VRAPETTPDQRVEAAELARANLAATIRGLRTSLKPRNLIEEIARGSGLGDGRAINRVGHALERRPLAILLLAGGVGLWIYSQSRLSSARVENRASLRAAIGSLVNSGTNAFRKRARARSDEVLATAQDFIAGGAARLFDTVQDEVGGLIEEMPASAGSRLLVECAVQLAMMAALEALLPQQTRGNPAE
jgi:hypothetical protein